MNELVYCLDSEWCVSLYDKKYMSLNKNISTRYPYTWKLTSSTRQIYFFIRTDYSKSSYVLLPRTYPR